MHRENVPMHNQGGTKAYMGTGNEAILAGQLEGHRHA